MPRRASRDSAYIMFHPNIARRRASARRRSARHGTRICLEVMHQNLAIRPGREQLSVVACECDAENVGLVAREQESVSALSFVFKRLLCITVDPPYLALGCSSLSFSNVFHNRTRLSSPPEASQVPEPFEHVRALTQLLWASKGV